VNRFTEYLRKLRVTSAWDREIKDEPPTPVVIVGYAGSDDSFNAPPDTSGRIPSVEQNSAATYAYVGDLKTLSNMNGRPIFGTHPTGGSAGIYAQPKLFQTTLTATAGGEIAAANVGPPSLGGYQACMVITHVYSDQTDAGIAFTIAPSAGGLDAGVPNWTVITTANQFTDYHQGLAWQADTDAATIQFACAGGEAGNAQQVTFCGFYWYET